MPNATRSGGISGDGFRGAVLGVILAGGQSRRMGGGDKTLASLGGRTLLMRVIERLAPQVDGLILNANGDPARFAEVGLDVVADSVEGYAGPLAGVLAGLEAAKARGAAAIVTAAGDTPFFPTDLRMRLQQAAEQSGGALALAASPDEEGRPRRHPTFGFWPTALAEDLRHALVEEGLRKVVLWTDRHDARQALFPLAAGGDPFFNVNTPDDMAAAEARLAGEETAARKGDAQ